MVNAVVIILLAMLFSAFFSGMEIAFVASNKLRIELDRKQGVFGSDIVRIFARHPGQFIATMLIGNNIALVIYGLFFSDLLNPSLSVFIPSDALILILSTIISTAILLLFSEFLPKTIFVISPNFFLKILSIPTLLFYWIFYPISKFTLGAANLILKIFFKNRSHKTPENIVFGKVDLDHFLDTDKEGREEHGQLQDNIRIFRNALDFSSVRLRECMVPRT